MKTNFISIIHQRLHLFEGVFCAGAVLLMASRVSGQNLFASDYGSHIYAITPGGVESTFAGGMDYPYGLAFDGSGDLYVANSHNNSPGGYITKIAPGGTQSTFATGIDTISIAVDKAGYVYAADYRSGNLYEYTPDGVRSTIASGFGNPLSLAFDNAGDLFVGAGYGNNNGYITEIKPTGMQSVFASGLSFPAGMAFNSSGNLFVASQTSGVIYEYSATGARSTYITLSTSSVSGLAFDSAGDLFAGAGGSSILEVTPGGTLSTFATIPNGLAGLAFQVVPEPTSLAFAGLGGLAALATAWRRKQK